MNNYVIKDKGTIFSITDISRIGIVKRAGSEWMTFIKTVELDTAPDFAAVRFDSFGVCGLYVNGQFIISSAGKYPNRITYAEITSMLKAGQNEIKFVLGGHFYQDADEQIVKRRGAHFSSVAAEIEVEINGKKQTIKTDDSWSCVSDDGQTKPTCYTQVTQGEYDRFWLSAALIPEYRPINVPKKITEVVGKGYTDYVSKPWESYAYPQSIVETNMTEKDGCLTSEKAESFVIYDFGRINVGYTTLKCVAEEDGEVEFLFDYEEKASDFTLENKYAATVKKLAIKKHLEKGENEIFLLRRRACRYMKLSFSSNVRIVEAGIKLRMTPAKQHGWFNCDDELFNKMWEVGKYTLHVNKHTEYESCPRNEMKFFTGDGVIDALVDSYAFGDSSLVYSSLSLNEPFNSSGIRGNRLSKTPSLADYPAWRIIAVYTQYLYTGDKYLIEQYYDEMVDCTRWLVEQTNSSHLIYQYPVFWDQYFSQSGALEFSCSFDRLGEKPYTNAVFYKALLCMAEFADIVGDERKNAWKELANEVKKSFNERLWVEEKMAYVDTFDTSYIPHEGNVLAVMFGLADKERAERVMKTVYDLWTPYGSTILSKPMTHTRRGNAMVSPLMNTYEAEVRFNSGEADNAIELIRRVWGTMLDKGAKTFWEFSPNHPTNVASLRAHAWASGCTYLLSAYVLGIRPERIGFEEVRFEPYCGFDHFEGVVPTCKGLIGVTMRTTCGIKEFELAVPCGTKIKPIIPEDAKITIHEYK